MAFTATITVLVVDDEVSLLAVIDAILTRAGFRVLSAGDGEHALTICREYQDPIHIALVDIVMPGMPGPELRDRLSEEFPGIPVVLMTGYAPDEILSRGLDIGSLSGVLLKPFHAAELVARVQAEVEKLGTASGDS